MATRLLWEDFRGAGSPDQVPVVLLLFLLVSSSSTIADALSPLEPPSTRDRNVWRQF